MKCRPLLRLSDHEISLFIPSLDITGGDVQRNATNSLQPCLLRHFLTIRVGIYATRGFTLGYWVDDDWQVGKLKEVPGVFSQGETLAELEENIKDAYALVMADEGASPHPGVKSKEIKMDVA